MADQPKPNKVPANKISKNLGQQQIDNGSEQTLEPSKAFNPYKSPERGLAPQIDLPAFKSSEQAPKEQAIATARAEQIAEEEIAAAEVAEEAEEEAIDGGGVEETEQQPKFKEEELLTGAGGETGPSVQEELRREKMDARIAAAATAESAETEQQDQEQQIAAKKAKALPGPAQRISDRTIDIMMIGIMGLKDIVDASLFGIDLAAVGSLTAPFFITIVMVLRGMQKTRTEKKFTMFIGLILFCEAVPLLAMLPSSIILFYVLRFEDAAMAVLQKVPGQLKSGK